MSICEGAMDEKDGASYWRGSIKYIQSFGSKSAVAKVVMCRSERGSDLAVQCGRLKNRHPNSEGGLRSGGKSGGGLGAIIHTQIDGNLQQADAGVGERPADQAVIFRLPITVHAKIWL